MKTNDLLKLEKRLCLQELNVKHLGKWLTMVRSRLLKHLQDKEELIKKLLKNFVVMVFVIMNQKKKLWLKKIISMQEFLLKNKWMILVDKLRFSQENNTPHMILFQMYVQDLISEEKGLQKFWNPVYKEISEKLLLPIKTDLQDLATNSLNKWSICQVEKLQCLKIKKKHTKKNLQKTYCQSFTSSLVNKWKEENIKKQKTTLKSLKIKLYPTKEQKEILNQFIDTSRYVYNKTINEIENNKMGINFYNLRDKLVTYKTKKESVFHKEKEEEKNLLLNELKKYKSNKKDHDDIKKLKEKNREKIKKKLKNINDYIKENLKTVEYTINPNIKDFELNTPKDVRANAVKRCCDDYKTSFANLRNGNIRFFVKKFKKKTDPNQSFTIEKENIKFKNKYIDLFPNILKENSKIKIGSYNKKYLNTVINYQTDFIRFKKEYYIYIVIKTEQNKYNKTNNIAGVDPGLRDFATVHINNFETNIDTLVTYKHPIHLIEKLNKKIDQFKKIKELKKIQYKLKKDDESFIKYPKIKVKHYNKIEKRKNNIINQLHWSFTNHLLKNNDIIYFGDIKSHDVVTNNKIKKVNRLFNDLKFYQLKQKLLYKASIEEHKIVYLINEAYTSKTCSSCGIINDVKSSKIYNCKECKISFDRDENSAKNIKMKGFLS